MNECLCLLPKKSNENTNLWAKGLKWAKKLLNIAVICWVYSFKSGAQPHWICYAYAKKLICMRVGSTSPNISFHFGQPVVGPETLNIWPYSSSIS